MAKNKKKSNNLQLHLNEENYIKTGKARNLPIARCVINADWQDTGMASIIVVRQHVNQNVTLGLYMVDVFCVGVKDTHFYFNISNNEFLEIADIMSENYELAECDYNLAHNIIYGSAAFAEEFDIPPHNGFKLTKMILEEDDDHIPLIEVEFGKDGVPFLIGDSDNPKMKFYHSQLLKNAGEGNFLFLSEEDVEKLENEYLPELWEEEDWNDFFEDLDECETEEELMDVMVESFEVVQYISEKTLVTPMLESKNLSAQNLEMSETELVFEPISILDYKESNEEIQELEICNKTLRDLHDSLAETDLQVDKLILKLQKAIIKWPKNPVFLNYLFSAYQLTGNFKAASDTAKLTLKLFPSYLFAKIAYARLLIQKGKLEKVPELFNGKYNLKSVYPDRDKFHVQEFLAFNNLWCNYFLEKDDLYTANFYYSRNIEIDIPEEFMVDVETLLRLNIKICDYVKDLIFSHNSKFTRYELIKTLVN